MDLSPQIYTITGHMMVNWTAFDGNSNEGKNVALTWYAMKFANPKEGANHLPISLDLGGMGKGFAWVNGNGIGRYWNIISDGECTFCNYNGEESFLKQMIFFLL